MPVAIVMSNHGAIPAVLMEDTAAALIKRLQSLEGTPELKTDDQARQWLQEQPHPSGWFSTPSEARAHVKRTHEATPVLSGEEVSTARKALGMSREEFATALGYGGNSNTRHKLIFEIENEATDRKSKKLRIMNASATLRLRSLMAEHGLDEPAD
ncbi:hypothetical protein KL867_17795 [Ruegeria litorea]|uniref:HTH cro/C1-type domain-containing protein n=1 Tax=Falsiruegeria litorea TaxID=1280831 RepID=A0ABS5WUV2_9RHOB|nr:hypothetical protein [Falsiruegeria litorea]MBT3142926.1 hypothetical protein [Falsiruegeria litorea]